VKQVSSGPASAYGTIADIWTKQISTGASMTVSLRVPVSSNYISDNNIHTLAVEQVTGYDSVGDFTGLTGSEAVSQNTGHSGVLNLSLGGTTSSDSLTYGVVSADGGSAADQIDAGTGWSWFSKNYAGTDYWWNSVAIYKAGSVSTADWAAWTSSYGHAASALEIKAATGDATLWLYDYEIDYGLNAFTLADKIVVCSQKPTTYTEANTTYKIGEKSFSVGAVVAAGPQAATPNGRQIVTAAVTGGTITTNGTPTHWGIVDTVNSRLLAAGTMTGSEAVTTTDTWTLGAMTINVPSQVA
jgi:hypothetical protein